MNKRVASYVLLALLAVCRPAVAQSAPSGKLPAFELGVYVGAARNSPVGSFLGVTPDRDHLFIGVHVTANVIRTTRWTFGYAPEVVPVLIVSNNPKYVTQFFPSGAQYTTTVAGERGPVAGFAVSPIGLESQLRVARHWRLYAAGAAGCVWFSREVPVASSRAFNYTVEWGGGVLWQFGDRTSLRAGYKFHHLSNAYTRPQNPGVDGNVFLIGWQRAFGARRF